MCGPTKFVVTDLGIYLRDVYEFNGFQPLGIWTKKRTYGKAKIKSMFDQSLAEIAIQYIQEPFCAVFNSDFRAYRKKYDKGEDFFIFSDVAWEKPKEDLHYYTTVQINIPHIDFAPWIKKYTQSK